MILLPLFHYGENILPIMGQESVEAVRGISPVKKLNNSDLRGLVEPLSELLRSCIRKTSHGRL